MTTYLIKDRNNQIIFKSENYIETLQKYQELKKIDNQYLTIFVKSILNRF